MRPLFVVMIATLLIGIVVPWLCTEHRRASGPVVASSLPRSLDPAMASRLDEFRLITALFEPLMRLDPLTLIPQPALATAWESSPDHRVWTFHLDSRARWSDHSDAHPHAVTAQDMRRGLLRHLIVHSPNAFYLDGILVGAKQATQQPQDVGVDCPDEHTLVLRLTHPVPHLPAIMSLSVFVPATDTQVTDGDLRQQSGQWTDPRAIIGNGPMRCVDHVPRHHYDLTPNSAYRGEHPAHGDVRVLIVEDAGAALRLYLSGQVDAILSLSADALGDLRQHHIDSIDQADSLGTEFLRVRLVAHRTGENPEITRALADPRLRRALARSIDRGAITDVLLRGNARPATSFCPPVFAGTIGYHPPVQILESDFSTAKSDLDALRVELGMIPEFDLVIAADPVERVRAAELMIDGWRRTLGLAVNLSVLPPSEARNRERTLAYDLARVSWLGDFLDPTTFLDCFRCGAGANRTGYCSSTYDALLDRALECDGAQRLDLLQQAELQLLTDVPLIPLYHTRCSFLIRPGLRGIHANALESVQYSQVEWERNK